MAKKARGAAKQQPPALSPVLQAMLAESRKGLDKDGEGNTYIGKEMEEKNIGIPLPHLSLMYLFDSTVLGLGKIYGIAGPSQSQKSSLGFEILNWIFRNTGGGRLIECEGQKYSPSLIRSLLGDYADQLLLDRCKTIQDAQTVTTSSLQVLRDVGKRKILFGLLVDSIAGVETDSTMVKLEKEGFMNARAFPEAALAYTRFFKTLSAMVSDLPVVFLFVNHLKDVPSQMPGLPPTKSTPGGKAQRFHSATYLWVKRTSLRGETKATRMIDGESVIIPQEIRPLEILCDKNSLGIEGRKIYVDFWWYRDLQNVQHSIFDWEAATADLVAETQELRGVVNPGPDGRYAKLKEICDVTVHKGLYTSDALGMKAVEAHVMGQAIENSGMMQTLVDFYGIRRHTVWDGTPLPEAPPPPTEPDKSQPEIDPPRRGKNDDPEPTGLDLS